MKKYKSKIKKELNKKILIFILFYILVLSLYLTSKTISKYIGQTNGTVTTEVAKWFVDADLDTDVINMVNGPTTKTCRVVVLSNSDISSTYSINLSNVPNGLEVAFGNGEFETVQNNEIQFENVGAFTTNQSIANEHMITFRAPLEIDEEIEKKVHIDVVFTQDDI